MKRLATIFAGILAAGCATAQPSTLVGKPATQPVTEYQPDYQPKTASALCFASPLTPPYPLEGLDRSAREPSAFMGYDQSDTETYVIYSDNSEQDFSDWGGYQRDSISYRVGTRSR
jgi:hypothetical protein